MYFSNASHVHIISSTGSTIAVPLQVVFTKIFSYVSPIRAHSCVEIAEFYCLYFSTEIP